MRPTNQNSKKQKIETKIKRKKKQKKKMLVDVSKQAIPQIALKGGSIQILSRSIT